MSSTRHEAHERSWWVLALVVAAWTMLGIPAHATYGARVTADEPQYLLSAISIAEDADLDIADELAAERYRPFHRVDLPRQTVPLDDGRELSPHDPLLPVLLALPVRAGGWIAAKAVIAALAGGLAATTAWVASERFGVRRAVAWWVVLGTSCAAPLATYATQIYPEIPAALATMLGVALVSGALGRRDRWAFVITVTALVWLSVKYAPVGVALAGVALWRLRAQRRRCLMLVGALAASALVYVVAHRWLYGGYTPYASGDHFVSGGELSVIGSSPDYVGRARRITGLLVDDSFGLAPWAPVWFLLPLATGALLRRRPPRVAALVAPLLAGWFVATFVALTMHGWWWPGRQLVVVLPVGVVVLARAVDHIPALRTPTAVALALGVATWAWTTAEAVTRARVLVVDFDRTANPWHRFVAHLLPDGRRATLGDDLGLVAWSVLLGGSALVGMWLLGGRAATPPPASHPDSVPRQEPCPTDR